MTIWRKNLNGGEKIECGGYIRFVRHDLHDPAFVIDILMSCDFHPAETFPEPLDDLLVHLLPSADDKRIGQQVGRGCAGKRG